MSDVYGDIHEKLQQHKDNLDLWEMGWLTPTEPDEVERRVTMAELRAAIKTLEWVLEVMANAYDVLASDETSSGQHTPSGQCQP